MGDHVDERLVRIETKLDMLLQSESDKEARLRKLERREAMVVGACLVISFVMPILVKKLGF